MAALDNPFYFSLSDDDKADNSSLLRSANSLPRCNKKQKLKPLVFSANNEAVRYYNVRGKKEDVPAEVEEATCLPAAPVVPRKPSFSSVVDSTTSRRQSMAHALRLLQHSSARPNSQVDHVATVQQNTELYCDHPQSLKLKVASKRRNMSYQNKKQETEIGGVKQCLISLGGRRYGGEMLDVAIFSSGRSEAAKLWVKYLSSCFQQISKEEQKPPFKLSCINVDDLLLGREGGNDSGWAAGGSSRLQVVVVCPLLLDSMASGSFQCGRLAALLQPATVVAMLLGVTSQALDNHPLAGLFRFEQWRRMVVKDRDPTFVGDLMGVSMDILSRSWQFQQAIHQMNPDNNKAHFSIVPKKIKVGQNKVMVLLTTPLSANDKVNVFIDKNGQKVEVASVKRRNPYTLQFSMPVVCLQTSMLVSVNVERNGRSLGQRLVKCESRLRELNQLLRTVDNPLHFMCQALGLSIGDREQLDNFLVESLQKNAPPNFNLLAPPPSMASSVVNPPHSPSNEEYPTLLHFAAHFGLEKVCLQLLEWGGGAAEQACQLRNVGQMTPAELSEWAGHPRLANALKGYQQMSELTSMYHYVKGISEKPQVADPEGGETPVVRSPTPGGDDCNYLLPRPLSDTYLVPPAARPIEETAPLPPPPSMQFYYKVPGSPVDFCPGSPSTPPPGLDGGICQFPPPPSTPTLDYPKQPPPLSLDASAPKRAGSSLDSYQTPGIARPFTPVTPTTPSSPGSSDNNPHHHYHHHQHHDFAVYLQMHSPDQLRLDLDFSRGKYKNVDTQSQNSDQYSINNGSSHGSQQACGSSTSSGSAASCKMTSPQDELVEIINDFKNNVFTISEVEKLVEAWRNRNDVQQSFREKQEQLNQMRQEYERIQQAMKEQMKRATPFERIKKFFSRKSKHVDVTVAMKEGCIGGNRQEGCGQQVCHRPVSSLSLHSSSSCSSCGRMSTGSGTSLGDSGTHSDHDEKKSEDFIYHEKLQAVKENDIALASEEYVTPSADTTITAIPKPPNTTVALVHREYVPDGDEEEEGRDDGEKVGLESNENRSEEMETLEQSVSILEKMAAGIAIAGREETTKDSEIHEVGRDPENGGVGRDPGSETGIETLEANNDPEIGEELPQTELPDYVNVCPLPTPPPPIPPRARYKGVIL